MNLATASLVLLFILGPATAQNTGWIHVTLNDNNGAVIPGIEVTVREAKSRASVARVISNERGATGFSLPAGLYSVEATGEEILTYKRAPFHIENNTHKWVTIIPLFVTPSASRAELEDKLQYVTFPSLVEDHAVSIRYLKMRTVNGIVEYEGYIELSYGSTTVLCDTLRVKSLSNIFDCAGSVRLFIGNEQFGGNMCEIDVTRQLARLTREPVLSLPIK